MTQFYQAFPCVSTASDKRWVRRLVSRASPIPFHSADRFQYPEEGSGDLGPLFVDLYVNLNRANEIAEHIIRADFVT